MPTLNALLDRSAQEGGEKIALAFGEREVSFHDLRREVLQVAEGLRRTGIVKGDRIAIVHRNAPEFIVAYFAASRLGAIAVPINFMVSKADELAYMLGDCGAKGGFLPLLQHERGQVCIRCRTWPHQIARLANGSFEAPSIR